jgi:N-ethylmaleimide reductase
MPGGAASDSDGMAAHGTDISALDDYPHMIEGVTQGRGQVRAGSTWGRRGGRFPGAYIANNGCTPRPVAEAVRNGLSDLASFGRPYLSNPDLAARIRNGVPLAPAAATDTRYGGGRAGHTNGPRAESRPART